MWRNRARSSSLRAAAASSDSAAIPHRLDDRTDSAEPLPDDCVDVVAQRRRRLQAGARTFVDLVPANWASDVRPVARLAFDDLPRCKVGLFHDFRSLEDLAARHVPIDEPLVPFVSGGTGEDVDQLLTEAVILAAEFDRTSHVTIDQIGPTDLVAEPAPELRFQRGEKHDVAVARQVRVVEGAQMVIVAVVRLATRTTPVVHGELGAVRLHQRVPTRQIDPRTTAAGADVEKRGADGHRR